MGDHFLVPMLPSTAWKVIPLLEKLEFDGKLTPRAQTVARLLSLDLKKIREDTTKSGNYWHDLTRYQNDQSRLQACQELFQRHLNRMTAQMEVLYDQLRASRNKEIKVDLLSTVVSSWNSIIDLLVKQFPPVKGCKKVCILQKGQLYCIDWEE